MYMTAQQTLPHVELLAIGNELLVGQVQDTNSHWLVRNLTTIGAVVRRVQLIRDEYDEIEFTFKAVFARSPRLVITTGGLGPTDDDLTARALAQTLGVNLEVNEVALEMVRQRYAYLATLRPNYSAELNEPRRKMAYFPVGARPLTNVDGAAPAIELDIDSATGKIVPCGAGNLTIVCLPGVPKEMKEIFSNSMQAVLARTIGAGGYIERNIILERGDESRIAQMLQEVQALHAGVYIKSRGQIFPDHGQRLTVVLSSGGQNLETVRTTVAVCEDELRRGLADLGYGILGIIDS